VETKVTEQDIKSLPVITEIDHSSTSAEMEITTNENEIASSRKPTKPFCKLTKAEKLSISEQAQTIFNRQIFA